MSSIFTSCTGSTEEQIQELELQEKIKATGGEDEQDPDEDPDEESYLIN
ncbi:hypothetical protein [uncultured Tenacibaculum sp.]|nr:hypothetical protein [uncultured Tenacibaculum sp.]